MLKQLLTIFIIALFSLNSNSQETKDDLTRLKNGEDLNVLYRNEASFGVFAHTASGFGIAYRRGQHMTAKRKRMFEVEAQNFKHPKEVKTVNPYIENAKGFIFGKLNSVLLLRGGAGIQKIIFQKSDKKSVEIRYSYFFGATLAFAKPVYLELIMPNTDPLSLSTEQYDPERDSLIDIFGKAPFFTGINKTKIYPALYGKLALSFEYADRYDAVKAIETGIIGEYYPKAIPMMAFNENPQFYVQLYLKIIWGRKWF